MGAGVAAMSNTLGRGCDLSTIAVSPLHRTTLACPGPAHSVRRQTLPEDLQLPPLQPDDMAPTTAVKVLFPLLSALAVLTLVEASPPPRCLLSMAKGHCLAYMPSWYFNSQEQRCLQFIYGGCGGNENRFVSELECNATCSS